MIEQCQFSGIFTFSSVVGGFIVKVTYCEMLARIPCFWLQANYIKYQDVAGSVKPFCIRFLPGENWRIWCAKEKTHQWAEPTKCWFLLPSLVQCSYKSAKMWQAYGNKIGDINEKLKETDNRELNLNLLYRCHLFHWWNNNTTSANTSDHLFYALLCLIVVLYEI